MLSRRASFIASLVLAAAAPACGAAAVRAVVTDASGHALADAIVTLQPSAGRLPVRPMAEVQIAQHDLRFDPVLTVVTVGTPVLFPNRDTVRHHVYSFSSTKTFQLKLYAGVPHKPVVFDKPGIAVLGCNIHDQMVAWVVVVDTPLWARSDAGGRAQVDGVAPGSYQMRVWHATLAESTPPVVLPLLVAGADVEQPVRLGRDGSAK